jgi:GDP-4-dehydro-6-deoxy-D-mannose reductase
MKFLVTGGTGFAGSHLINRLLKDDHELTVMVRNLNTCSNIKTIIGEENLKKINFVYGDLSETETVSRHFEHGAFDGVFHLGAFAHPHSSFETPLLACQTSFLSTAVICDKILERMPECVLMHCSSPEVYGLCPPDARIKEDYPINPNNPYAVAKAAADLYVLERAKTTGLKTFLTRAFSHTGPKRRSNFSISSDAIQIARILKGQQEPVIKIGNMKSERIVADVRDIVDVYYRLMLEYQKGNIATGEIFHIAGNELHTMQYYLDTMLKIADLPYVTLEIEPKFFRKVDIPIQIPDDTKVRELLNWEPTIPIEKTLEDLINYWLGEI